MITRILLGIPLFAEGFVAPPANPAGLDAIAAAPSRGYGRFATDRWGLVAPVTPDPVPLAEVLWGELDLRYEAIVDGTRFGFAGGIGIDVHPGLRVVPTVSGGLLFRWRRATSP